MRTGEVAHSHTCSFATSSTRTKAMPGQSQSVLAANARGGLASAAGLCSQGINFSTNKLLAYLCFLKGICSFASDSAMSVVDPAGWTQLPHLDVKHQVSVLCGSCQWF